MPAFNFEVRRTNEGAQSGAAPSKPCASCGSPVPSGCLCCAPCYREQRLQFLAARPWLRPARGL